MSIININSSSEFSTLLRTSTIVVADFYADWCGPCKAIAPLYAQLATKHSKKNSITFTKINVDNQQAISQQYGVTAMPTFLIFHSGSVIQTLRGADARTFTSAVEAAAKLAGGAGGGSSSSGAMYATPGRTLGGQTGSRAGAAQMGFRNLFERIVAFFGLYFVSLLSFDPYRSAEGSMFNIHRQRTGGLTTGGKVGAGRSGSGTGVKRVGTLADISG